ncbi:expressed protein [Chlorella variabilis]|uniref:Expressed protein n=1 Tax=Chlorella variabilis TaxID=554065 RepID=E1Z4Z4_CHLVA|nr:expressed protein [Chlorella variabilis]EFN59430.1 expressed protein [Chlorella variabilis]|eukprot:XP_005851532.1 expressed protein [Chlorella variabilis]
MSAGALHQMASLGSLAKFIGPAVVGSMGYWFWYRKVYGWTHTCSEEWYTAEERYMNAVMASLGQVASFIIPVAVASAGAYYLQRHTWPMGRTINKEWYDASEAYLNNMPVHSTGKTVRMNPGSEKIKTNSMTF